MIFVTISPFRGLCKQRIIADSDPIGFFSLPMNVCFTAGVVGQPLTTLLRTPLDCPAAQLSRFKLPDRHRHQHSSLLKFSFIQSHSSEYSTKYTKTTAAEDNPWSKLWRLLTIIKPDFLFKFKRDMRHWKVSSKISKIKTLINEHLFQSVKIQIQIFSNISRWSASNVNFKLLRQ